MSQDYSQLTDRETQSQNLDFGEDFSMRTYKRPRKGSYSKKRNDSSIMRVPRAISTRGTPDGYYEIPMRQLFRVYVNTSSGFWDTNQSTSAPLGVTGYLGMSIWAALDNTYISLGNGTASAVITTSVPDYSSAQNLFDCCKIADMSVDMWYTNHSRELASTASAYGAMEAYFAEDVNDSIPPSAINQVLDKKRVVRAYAAQDKTFKFKIKPHITGDASGNDGAGSSTTLGITTPATYIRTDRPAVSHFGIKGFCVTPTSGTSYSAILNILVTQKRRYKVNN